MTTYTSKNGHLAITDEVSGGYSHELTYPSNARVRNAELKLVLVDCLKMTKRIAELEKLLDIAFSMDVDDYESTYSVKWLANKLIKGGDV